MKRIKTALLLIILAIGVFLYFWKPWTMQKERVNLENAPEIVKAAQEETTKVDNYKYNTDLAVGDQINVAISNRVIRDKQKKQMVNFTWDIPKMSGTAGVYTEGSKIYIFHPLKDKWMLPREEPTLSPFMDFFWRQVGLVDPVENLMKLDPYGKNISVYTKEKKAGLVGIEVIPQGSALSEIEKALPPQFAGAELKDVRQLFWISQEDFLVTQYEVHARVSFFGIKTMNFKAVTKPKDYNKTEIKIPKQLQDKMGQDNK